MAARGEARARHGPLQPEGRPHALLFRGVPGAAEPSEYGARASLRAFEEIGHRDVLRQAGRRRENDASVFGINRKSVIRHAVTQHLDRAGHEILVDGDVPRRAVAAHDDLVVEDGRVGFGGSAAEIGRVYERHADEGLSIRLVLRIRVAFIRDFDETRRIYVCLIVRVLESGSRVPHEDGKSWSGWPSWDSGRGSRLGVRGWDS